MIIERSGLYHMFTNTSLLPITFLCLTIVFSIIIAIVTTTPYELSQLCPSASSSIWWYLLLHMFALVVFFIGFSVRMKKAYIGRVFNAQLLLLIVISLWGVYEYYGGSCVSAMAQKASSLNTVTYTWLFYRVFQIAVFVDSVYLCVACLFVGSVSLSNLRSTLGSRV